MVQAEDKIARIQLFNLQAIDMYKMCIFFIQAIHITQIAQGK